jgi:hypothetical protein
MSPSNFVSPPNFVLSVLSGVGMYTRVLRPPNFVLSVLSGVGMYTKYWLVY